MITVQVQRIEVSKDEDRKKIYTPVDITSQVVMPIIDVERLDNTLDSSSLTLINEDGEAIKPFTRIIIRLDDGTTKQNLYRLVYSDETEILTYGLAKKYKHNIELLEPTKWLERFELDNTTITNLLEFLYEDPYAGKDVLEPYWKETIYNSSGDKSTLSVYDEGYKQGTNYKPYYVAYDNGETLDLQNTLVKLICRYKRSFGRRPYSYITQDVEAKLDFYSIRKQGQTSVVVYQNGNWNITETQLTTGYYTITQIYEASYNGVVLRRRYNWNIKVRTQQQTEKKPQRKTIAEVVQIVLNRVGDESSLLRENELPFFNISTELYNKLNEKESPEFTFSQNTLFGVLEQIGEEIHSIPRLIPNETTLADGTVDDWSNWNLITFDELGGEDPAGSGQVISKENSYNGDNYATSFTTNVENSFQTNKEDYISITEPYDGGFISVRTESSDYEVSDNSACIKLSRPVHRILEVICRVTNSDDTYTDVDITPYVKEATDYNLLDDYVSTSQATPSIGYKDMAIYFTRGDNVIRGLDYIRPTQFSVQNLWTYQAIYNILRRETGNAFNVRWTVGWAMKDLMFRVKYVPYYGLKLKQYKGTIENDSGNNELFYNQQNSQMVDIESYGEKIKGALLRTANEEISRTEYYTALASVTKIGQKKDQYYAYQVNKEITNYRIKATIEYSKNWNKWNEYVAIKKNYRQWEISEKESIKTNPVKNEFCIATTVSNVERRNLNKVVTGFERVDGGELPDGSFLGWMTTETEPTNQELTDFAMQCLPEGITELFTGMYLNVTYGNKQYNYYYNRITEVWTGYEVEEVAITGNYIGALEARYDANRNPGDYSPTVPTSWGMGYYYELTNDTYTGRKLTRTASGAPFTTESQLLNATTFYHDGEAIAKADIRPGDYAIYGIAPLIVSLVYHTEGSDDKWEIDWSISFPYGVPNTRTYDSLLTTFTKKVAGSVNENDILYVARYSGIEPVFVIYRYEAGQWVEKLLLQLIETTPAGYGIPNFDYLLNQFNGIDGFGSRPAILQMQSRLADNNSATYKAIDWVVMTTTSEEYDGVNYNTVENTFLSPCACFAFGNSVVVNFEAKDNYSAGTTVEMWNSTTYAIENYVKYSDKYGNFNRFKLVFGAGNAKSSGFDNKSNSLNSSKKFYKIETSEINENSVMLDYRENAFKFFKDSRQQVSYTGQLHFVSETEDITFGKAFAQNMPFVGNTKTETGSVKFVGFTEKPSKYLNEKATAYEELTNKVAYNCFTRTIALTFDNDTLIDFVGVGIIDSEENIMLYFNKEVEAGNSEKIYLEITHDI